MFGPVVFTPATRHRLTRAVCWLVLCFAAFQLAAQLTIFVVVALLLIEITLAGRQFVIPIELVLFALYPIAAYFVIATALYVWRSCEKCGYHLYNMMERSVVTVEVRRRNEAPRPPHPLSATFLGAVGLGAVWAKALRGVAHCPWCGHADKLNVPSAPPIVS